MSKDCRVDLIREVETLLIKHFPDANMDTISSELLQVLSSYEVTKRSTELTVYINENEKIISKYCACLFIDGKSEKTIAQYRRTVTKMFEAIPKSYKEIGAYDIRLFLAYEKSRNVSNRTLENTRANLSAFFQWLAAEDEISKNPCASVKPIKYDDVQRFPFSSVEIDSLRSACNTCRERALIETLLCSGVRVSEITSLAVNDLNFVEGKIHVRHGKGGKERVTYINDIAKKYLIKYTHGRTDSVFTNRKQEPLHPDGVRYILNRIAKRAGVSNVHPHRFRRTFATNLARRGMKIQDIQRLLGHSNINTTLEYVSMNDEAVRVSYNQYIY